MSPSSTPEKATAHAPKATVEDASPSPSASPAQSQVKGKGKAAAASDSGSGFGSGSEEDWDPAVETLPDGTAAPKTTTDQGAAPVVGGVLAATPAADPSNPWQAVWSVESNAWYFWNAKTGEVTWTNPIAPVATATDVIVPEGIDPALAHLLPKPAPGMVHDPAFQQAKFNARTGRFTAHDFEHTVESVSEVARMRRMNEVYFDVEEWEKQREAEYQKKRKRDEDIANGIATSSGPKKPSKKEMKRFRAKRAEKKAHSHAWLRERD